MKILIIAATGALGRVVTRRALDAGHEVTALVRTPEKLGELADEVRVVKGGLGDAGAIDEAVSDVEAAIWCAGPARGSLDPEVFGSGMRLVTEAMRTHGVRRIVAISGAAMPVEGDEPNLRMHLARFMMKLVPAPIVECSRASYDVLAASDLDWVVVRSSYMRDGAPRGNFRADAHHDVGGSVTRSELADFMLEQLTSSDWLRKAPCVASG